MRIGTFALGGALVLGLLVAPFTAAAQDEAEPTPTPTPPPPLIEQLGIVVTDEQATERIAFRPFLPVPRPLEIALIPPFHNPPSGDNPRNYGVGYEFLDRGRHYVLREWPLAGSGGLAQFPPLAGESACTNAYLLFGNAKDIRGIGWQTNRVIFALQPDDGLVPIRDRGAALKAEWHRLAVRGACR